MVLTSFRFVYIIVFATGLFSLVYQIVWQRYLTFLVGADSRSSVITLTIFLTALSLGYWGAGALSRHIKKREIFWYGMAEVLIGAWAIGFPLLFKLSFGLIETHILNGLAGDVLLAALLTAVPALAMGATLPFLTQGLSRSFQGASQTHAFVYATNTFGACVGALLTGFLLIPSLGLSTSLWLVGTLNLALGLATVGLSRVISPSEELTSQVQYPVVQVNHLAVYVVIACSGYLLIGLESYVIRLFSHATDGSNYAYPTVVTAFIAAIGLGAFLSGRLMALAAKWYGLVPVITLIGWGLVYFSIPSWPYADYVIKFWCVNLLGDLGALPLARFVAIFGLVLIPVTASSMLLPFSFHFLKSRETSIGRTTGVLYTIATLATILGGMVGGHLLFGVLGNRGVFQSFLVVMGFMGLAALMAVGGSRKQRLNRCLGLTVCLVVVFVVPLKDFDKNLALTFYFENPVKNTKRVIGKERAHEALWNLFGVNSIYSASVRPEGSVAIMQGTNRDGSVRRRMITINGQSNGGSDGTDVVGNTLLGLIPYMLTPKPKRVLVVGIGTGVTIGAIAAQESVEQVDVCEINEAVIQEFQHFDFVNSAASKNPKVNIIKTDAVKFLLRTPRKYDLIISIPSNYWVAGTENLVTPEFHQIIKQALNPGGTYAQWAPGYFISRQALQIAARTFSDSFEGAFALQTTQYDFLMIYQSPPAEPAETNWRKARISEIGLRESVARVSNKTPEELANSKKYDTAWLMKLGKNAPRHSIDRPILGNAVLRSLHRLDPPYAGE